MKQNKKERRAVNMALAILLAFVFWLYVINVENPTGSATLRGLPVEIQGSETLEAQGLMVTDLEDETMDLKVNGRKKTLMKLDKKNVFLSLDVSSITQEGEYELSCKTVFPTHISTDNVSVSGWNEIKTTVTVEKQGVKTIPVRGEFIGTEAESCMAGSVVTDPSTLDLKGPVDSLDQIAYAKVQVGGDSVSETITQQIHAVFMDENGMPVEDLDNITSSATVVQVTVPVRQVVTVPLTVSFKDGGGATEEDVTYRITPRTITVVAGEDRDDLPESISLGEIDLQGVYGSTSYSLPITLPDGVVGWNAPVFASVSISMDKLESRQVATGNISLQNVPEGCTAGLVSPKLYVWVRGDAAAVNGLTADQIQVTVDLSGAGPREEIQRFPAVITLVGDDLEGVGVVGTNYSVALRLTQ